MADTLNPHTQARISEAIMAKMADGLDVAQALDAVCGEGMFARLASALYHELRDEDEQGRPLRPDDPKGIESRPAS